MLKIACVLMALLMVAPLWSQVEPSATGGEDTADESSPMVAPPASGQAYPTGFSGEERQNHIAAGLVFTGAYTDNLMVGNPNNPTSDETYSVVPTISVDRETSREDEAINYGVGFTLYQHTSDLNSIAQSASVRYLYRLTKYTSINFQDSFNQNSNSFNQPNPFSNRGVSGGPPTDSQVLILPYENSIVNTLSGGANYQYGRNAMIGGSGSYGIVHWNNAGASTGLYDSDSAGANFSFSRRLTARHYLGASYRYSRIVTNPVSSTTTTDAVFATYTYYLSHSFTLSLMGGPQYYSTSQPPNPTTSAWTPTVEGSVAYRTLHTNLAASYARIVTGGGGLLGAYHSNSGALSARRQFNRTWSGGVSGGYSNYNSATPVYTSYNVGGHSWITTVSVQHTIGERMNAEAGYSHIHQTYGGVAAATQFPDSNRVYVSISYQYRRPLGR